MYACTLPTCSWRRTLTARLWDEAASATAFVRAPARRPTSPTTIRLFPMPAMPTRNIDSMGLNVGPQGFAGQDFLCIPVHYTQRDSGVDEYLVYCLCRRNLCNLDWTTVANTGPPPPGKDVDALIVDVYNNPNGSAPTLTAFEINNTQIVNATRRPAADTVDCGTHPDSEDCNPNASPGTRSGATRYRPAKLFCFVCSVLTVWTRRRIGLICIPLNNLCALFDA
ncbi:uncharacterized protein LOC129598165 [Paramacrobiotus metropolitanus]|uniref:uncharacterized protein LOC129598165 n=1 Tax=Paramacrobiotus metropolitanus TaxID=2943436 RepID=UPI002445B4EC|nr:uncharacterized protein LOC129598165 [Paramacrobiotus metropolitanus]XP_055351908.1 uncharacterized protein LOC129598165 [Paramacrobiotus metropolitanus]XP_055351909.1 uncharacterized protein LOC129598165 [Paramacrobiotus metropolitanus]XP_055351910.1 uncharacterized protein LOC129598165 [Paramacrobiotus metropolitanus]